MTPSGIADCNGVNYNHWKLFVVGMILIYPVGVPMTYTLMLFKDRHPLERLRLPEIEGNPEARKALQREIPFAVRMLTKRYRPGCYWWEVEESVFKIAVIG